MSAAGGAPLGTLIALMSKLTSLLRLAGPVLRPVGNAASFTGEGWAATRGAAAVRFGGRVRVQNHADDREVMLTSVAPRVTLLSDGPLDGLAVRTTVRSLEPTYPPREDGYWTAYVVQPFSDTRFEVDVEVTGDGLAELYAAWVAVDIGTYGAQGPRARSFHEVLSLRTELPVTDPTAWREVGEGIAVLPLRTNLLTPHDEPVATIARYVDAHARPGDLVTIGETPLAVMQGRFRHPGEIKLGWVARNLCYMLSGHGSLGTATGLQALIDQVGTGRVLKALVKGSIGKARGRDGDFYRTAGDAAKLIDDVTGTLPPYDRFVVLGPDAPERVVAEIAAATGLGAAVVDANDLGRVDVIAASEGVRPEIIERALRSNPAGNGAETTPIVLVRAH